jgi:hypothetical protein
MKLTDAQLQEMVIDLAKLRGWKVHHTRPARTEKGWRTPISGHVGFPDLVLARGGQILILELKSESGRLTRQQQEWLDHLTHPTKGAAETDRIVAVFRPSQWSNIEELLK